ncbi:MAG TPA: SET domain-containing protein-lysine N-methyltransferase [archaeon]|nr:SET domain-containing protein-lysine N-methyltransferase [archaeon]
MGDIHHVWSHRWLTPTAEVRNSKIHGTGVFAKSPIKKGEVVFVAGGVVVPVLDYEKYRKITGATTIGVQINERFFICPSSLDEVTINGAINHSCNPNLGVSDSITMIVMRDITTGEELTIDYSFYETLMEPFECNCGARVCRKNITKNDWKIKKLQRKYGKYFSSYLKRRFIRRYQ